MKDPSGGRGLSVRQINSLLQNSQGHADDLGLLKPEVLSQPNQQLEIFSGQSDCSFPDISLQDSPKVSKADGGTKAIQTPPEFSAIVTSNDSFNRSEKVTPESMAQTGQGASPRVALEWLLNPQKSRSLTDRVMAHLIQFEAHESNIHYREDYRQTFIALSRAVHRHSTRAAAVPTEISSPRRLRVKGTDTDSSMGCRIESGETGVQVSEGGQSHNERSTPSCSHDSSNSGYQLPPFFIESSYVMYGVHPDQVWAKRMHDRRILLGKEFPQWCDDAGNFRPDIPKKPTLAHGVASSQKAGTDSPETPKVLPASDSNKGAA